MPDAVLTLVLTGLWLTVLISDLRQRRVAIPVLLGLLIVSLLGQPWWIITGLMILAPRRWIAGLAPIGLGAGLLMSDLAPGLAIAQGVWAWAMKWWGGADAIVLVALTLRYGWPGLIAGLVAVLVTAVVVFLKRERSPAELLLALDEVGRWQPRLTTEIPPESELPAAAALAVAGIVLEVAQVVAGGAGIK